MSCVGHEEDASDFVLWSLEANHYRNGEFGETRGRGKLKVHESIQTSSQTYLDTKVGN